MNPLKKADPVITDRLMEACKARMAEAPGAWGCVVLLTTQGKLYTEVYMSSEDVEPEKQILLRLSQAGDTQVEYAFCWPALTFSWRLRVGLLELDIRNLETRMLLPQEGDPRYKALRDMLSPTESERFLKEV